jgi:hypothetical protein
VPPHAHEQDQWPAVLPNVTRARILYFDFPTKALLLHSLAAPLLDGVHTLLDPYSDGPLAAPARRELVGALTDLLLAHRPVVAWLTRDRTALRSRGSATASRATWTTCGGS